MAKQPNRADQMNRHYWLLLFLMLLIQCSLLGDYSGAPCSVVDTRQMAYAGKVTVMMVPFDGEEVIEI